MAFSLKTLISKKKKEEFLNIKKDTVFECVKKEIEEVLPISVDIKKIKLQKNSIYIQESPLIRQELLKNKNTILSNIKNSFPFIQDIK